MQITVGQRREVTVKYLGVPLRENTKHAYYVAVHVLPIKDALFEPQPLWVSTKQGEAFLRTVPVAMGWSFEGSSSGRLPNWTYLFEGMRSFMNTLLVIAGVIAIVLLLVGGFNQALSFLLWVGIILLVLALLGWVLGRGRSRV
ncbi:hypothetical protein [Paenarthrobacter sp. NPDC058040]|uniref:hypothetical protein n=2 Tax=unclassified Paenarthrobacter TaxID=2634190 RepID=UPI0036DCAAC7